MKRVFQVSEITQLCKDIKSILEQCKEHVSAMRNYADQAGEALDTVPSEARYGIAVHDVSQLRSALKTEQMETALTKLEKCRQRACDLIPAADTDYASQTRELAGVTKSLQTLLEEMEQFLIDTPLTTDYSAFKKAFEEVQARWNKVTEDGEKAVEKLMANIKGAEAICHAFSKDPVNLSTGNFIYDRTDLEIGGRESFAFRRFYNAINAHRGVLGKDWNHNYEVHLEFTDGEAVLLREDGKRNGSSGKKTVTFPCLPAKVLWKKGKTDILTVQEIRKHTALTKKGNAWKPSLLQAAASRLLMKRKHRFDW